MMIKPIKLKNLNKLEKMNKSRKAMTWPYIVGLILVLVTIVALIGIPKEVSEVGEESAESITCQNSLAYSFAYKPLHIEGKDLLDKNNEFVHLKCRTDYEKTSETEDKELAFQIAGLLADCKRSYSSYWRIFDLSKNSVCIVCSSLEMPNNEVKEFIPSLKQLKPVADPSSNYLQYLFDVKNTSQIEIAKSAYYNLATEGRIAVVFVAGPESNNHFMQFGDYGVGLVKYKNLDSLNCNILEGDTELRVIK
jgi:hypothetical protein